MKGKMSTDIYLYPAYPVVLKSEATYISNLKTMAIEYIYKLISCPASEFDSLQVSEYDRLVKAGLEKVFDDRRTYYKENVAGK